MATFMMTSLTSGEKRISLANAGIRGMNLFEYYEAKKKSAFKTAATDPHQYQSNVQS